MLSVLANKGGYKNYGEGPSQSKDVGRVVPTATPKQNSVAINVHITKFAARNKGNEIILESPTNVSRTRNHELGIGNQSSPILILNWTHPM